MARRWTRDEADDIVRRFLKEGETATQIAKRYPPSTRNAILGVLHREKALGLGRAQMQSQPRASTKRRKSNPKPAPRPSLVQPEAEVAYLAPELVESVSTSAFGRNPGERRQGAMIPIRPVGPAARPLLQLGPNGCKFPVSEPEPGHDRLFCGEASEPGGVYCARCKGYTIDKVTRPQSLSDLTRIARRFS